VAPSEVGLNLKVLLKFESGVSIYRANAQLINDKRNDEHVKEIRGLYN
jgi:hypothetical protein